MLAQFSIWPLDQPHMSKDIAEITQVLEQSGVRYQVGPMSTTVEGSWQDVMTAIQACHETLHAAHQRVLTTITIDDDATRALNMSEALAKVTARREEAKSQ
jgi:uncharacterized protein (TIGR00106 family)